MQADRFTIKAQEAFAAAQRIAQARRNPQVTPLHLLLALLEQEGGIVTPVLQRAGADPAGLRRRTNEKLDALPKVTSAQQDGPPGFDGEVFKVLQRAEEEARGMSDEYVSTEHLLLAHAGDPKIGTEATRDQLDGPAPASPACAERARVREPGVCVDAQAVVNVQREHRHAERCRLHDRRVQQRRRIAPATEGDGDDSPPSVFLSARWCR